MNPKNLAIKLATAEKESEIITLLSNLGYWNNFHYWKPFGNNENNYSTIGNQQSSPDAALVEKLINSVDAILMKECMLRNIDMTGDDAPQNMADALIRFFNIKDGKLSYLDARERTKMAESIILAATGSTRNVNLTIVDKGEGQTPKRMPDTILSVSKNNKLKVPFVQGKFNMGGTGALPFCGGNRLQLIISKRCPQIADRRTDATSNLWSVTIVRREAAREGRKSSMFTYLTDLNGDLLTFDTEKLPIIPSTKSAEHENMYYGTYIKLYDYSLKYKTAILLNFFNKMNMLMPEIAHPIRLRECRKEQTQNVHTSESTISGLQIRLDEDRNNNIEDGFPSSEAINVDGQNILCSIYVFKNKDSAKRYRESEGLLFTVNGQTHATESESFFNRANLSYLADSILVLIDCSQIDIQHREDMFMNSRDRLRKCAFVTAVKEKIKSILKEHQGLKKLQNERRAAAVQKRLSEDRPFREVLQNILTKSPVLSKILLSGSRLTSPFNIVPNSGETTVFKGKKHPTFFKIRGKLKDGVLNKNVPINHDFRVQFETDVNNDYFVRPSERGYLLLKMDGVLRPDLLIHLGLFNGVATLTIALPKGSKVGDEHIFTVSIEDEYISQIFESSIHLIAEKEMDYSSGTSGSRIPPKDTHKKGHREEPNKVNMPNIVEKFKADWDNCDMDKNSALDVLFTTEGGNDYLLNMDNQYLLTELKGVRDQNKIALTKARYKYSMALVGMGIESYYKNQDNVQDSESTDVRAEIKKTTTMFAPILIPMIETMSDLDIEDV